jgi:NitT/TauT family transport system permease protein
MRRAFAMTDVPMAPASAARRAPVPLARIARAVLPPLAFCLVVIAGWEAMARLLASPLVPDVAEIYGELIRIVPTGAALHEIGVTLGRIVSGSALAFVVSLALGLAIARNKLLAAFFEPGIILGLTVPGLVWALLCVIWFGVSWKTPVVAIGLGVAPALTVSVVQGVRAIDPDLIEMAHVFRIPRAAQLRRLWLPAMVPFLLSGARLGFSLAWKVIVLVEIFGMSSGVGYQLNSEFSSQNVAGVLAWTIAFGVVMAVVEYGILQTAERRLTRWRRVARV